MNRLSRILLTGFIATCFWTCQKAGPSPYSKPALAATNSGSFSASVNSSSTIAFTPVKVLVGNYVVLKGVSGYYNVTITFPTSLGPGHYFFGSNNISGTIVSGSSVFVNDANVTDSGNFEITSISQGKYTATFSFFADDSTNHSNYVGANNGTISNM